MALLFVELLFLWQFWGRVIYGEKRIFARYGLVKNSRNLRDLVKGWATGFLLCMSLFASEIILGWAVVVEPISIRIAVEGLLSALGIAFAEEMLFRGWLLDELRRDYTKQTALWVTAIAFAGAHFLKPIAEIVRTAVTFPALVLLGIALVLAKYRHRDRLGICVGIHGGLVWGYYIVNVSEAIAYTNRVPVWVTGIDNNPIAGVMGLLFLSGLVWMAKSSNMSHDRF